MPKHSILLTFMDMLERGLVPPDFTGPARVSYGEYFRTVYMDWPTLQDNLRNFTSVQNIPYDDPLKIFICGRLGTDRHQYITNIAGNRNLTLDYLAQTLAVAVHPRAHFPEKSANTEVNMVLSSSDRLREGPAILLHKELAVYDCYVDLVARTQFGTIRCTNVHDEPVVLIEDYVTQAPYIESERRGIRSGLTSARPAGK